jgi:hypothetical protein
MVQEDMRSCKSKQATRRSLFPNPCSALTTSSDRPDNALHLLSHIYVARSEALWKEPELIAWFQAQVAEVLPQMDAPQAISFREDAQSMLYPREPIDSEMNTPNFICRHVVCSESTSWMGFLPPRVRNGRIEAYDPLPPSSAVSVYNDEYMSGLRPLAHGYEPIQPPAAMRLLQRFLRGEAMNADDMGLMERLRQFVERNEQPGLWDQFVGRVRVFPPELLIWYTQK